MTGHVIFIVLYRRGGLEPDICRHLSKVPRLIDDISRHPVWNPGSTAHAGQLVRLLGFIGQTADLDPYCMQGHLR